MNNNRYTTEILKYEILIEDMIAGRKNEHFKNVEEINTMLPQLKFELATNIKSKKDKHPKAGFTTDVRLNMNSLGK
jgi:hypothetical protein